MSDNTDDMNDLVLLATARDEAVSKVKELEAKLAKAVWRLEQMRDDDTGYRHVVHFRRGAAVTLAELKGQDDE